MPFFLRSLSRSIEAIVESVAPHVVGLESEGRSLGSGTIVRCDGLIATAAHALSGARAVVATFADGRRVLARRVAIGEEGGLALLRVDAVGLSSKPLHFGPPPRLGRLMVAIGRPPGRGPCAALGVVSSLGACPLAPFATGIRVEREAAGGPLVAVSGGVAAIASFAPPSGRGRVSGIPIALVAAALARLRAGEPSIGLGGWDQLLDESQAERLGVDGRSGILVLEIHAGGAAEQAGVKPLDVVVEASGRRVRSLDELARAVESAAAGDAAPFALTAIRGDRLVEFELELGWSERREGEANAAL
jgi:S1-C subfamily serine protease